MIVTQLPGFPGNGKPRRRGAMMAGARTYRDSIPVHIDEDRKWSWFIDIFTGDVIVVTDLHKGMANYDALVKKFPSPETVYLGSSTS